MNARLLSGCFVATLLSLATAAPAADTQPRAIAFVLDCSRSMGEALPPAGDEIKPISEADDAPTSRFDAADAALRAMLEQLASQGDSQVALWLYGHRLVWEQDTKHPDLLSQDAYLEATVGFDVLNGLLPGDDVEQAQPFRRFRPVDLQQLAVRLDALKPWGEKPLNLSLVRAIEAIADQPVALPRSIVVLTDGGNEQWLAKHKTSADRVAQVLKQNLVPIHVVYFGPAGSPAENELRSLARTSGGGLTSAAATNDLTLAAILSNRRKAVPVQTVKTGDTEADAAGDEATAPAEPLPAAPRDLTGVVLYYGKPVTRATITLEGSERPTVKADRQGRFLIRDVVAGRTYKAVVHASAKGQLHDKTVEVIVAPSDEEQPPITIDVK